MVDKHCADRSAGCWVIMPHIACLGPQEADKIGKAPDFFYCKSLLEETGVVTVPGSGFQQVSIELSLLICIVDRVPVQRA